MQRLYKQSIALVLCLITGGGLVFLSGCSTQPEQPVAEEKVEYSTFSGLREYGTHNGYEVLTPEKLQSCMEMQASFEQQKNAIKDLQASIALQREQVIEQNQEIAQIKQEIDKEQTRSLVEKANYEQHNALLEQYNQKVTALQEKLVGYNNMLEKYNQMSLSYNAGVTSFNEECAIDKRIYPLDLKEISVRH
ncbi:hypothetical protein [Thiomicrorhabdus xiamenensis]|uniref:Lipoprotein n=1 Tax=Thiomicrorhabdus xiamenensis TaxID=2739063 RepID=A0A7D4NQR1_9GAMM|nr:hypothetical protein [Thiomicrorhabdus xiamenensis]QKI89112.1 hypothetical protein HQN79_05775 [Thiomicrorhabdus xiamenensis]